MRRVIVGFTEEMARVGSTRGVSVRLTRSTDDDAAEGAFHSGELMLIALGSCVLGRIGESLAQLGCATCEAAVEVRQLPAAEGRPGRILVLLPCRLRGDEQTTETIRALALSGNVGSRLRRCGDVSVLFLDEAGPEAEAESGEAGAELSAAG